MCVRDEFCICMREEEEEEGRNWGRKVEHHDQELLLIHTGEDQPAQLLHLHSDLYPKANAQSR